MRFNATQGLTAHRIVNERSEEELAETIFRLGEERAARRIAKAIVAARPIESTTDLADVVSRAAGRTGKRYIHPATRTFQAVRMAVNDELNNIKEGLAQAIRVLGSGGRLVAISYHSLEDREVKVTMRESPVLKVLTKKPIPTSQEEVRVNPRSRSARMRVSERLDGGL
mgnify:CR=1 FL=1